MSRNFIVFFVLFLSSSWLIAQESKVRVVVDSARIYAEASTESYRIETIKKGTVLSLFGTNQALENWLYVYYQSPRWNSKVTGFIQAEMVEEFSAAQKPEEKPVEKPEEMPVEKPERIPETKPETKVEVPNPKQLPYPLSFPVGMNPRVYETKDELEADVLLEEAKPIVKPKDTIKTEVWKEEVVIPKTTEVPEKERDITEPNLPDITRSMPPQESSLFTISLGYGPSLGGIGGFIQLNTSGNFSVHWGAGYYPTSMFYPEYDWVNGKVLFSVGVKYYLPWQTEQVRPYLDLQYGGISVEAIRVVTGIWYYTYVYEDLQKTLWGPSLLAGIELRIGSFGLNGAVGASYVVTKWDYWDQPLFVTADIGFLLYF